MGSRSHDSVRQINSCTDSFKYSQIAGTLEGTVRGLSPLILKSEKVLSTGSGEPTAAFVPFGVSCAAPECETGEEGPRLVVGIPVDSALLVMGESEAGL